MFVEPRMVGKIFEITSGVHHIESSTDELFGAYVFGSSDEECAYSYPAGMCFTREAIVSIYVWIL